MALIGGIFALFITGTPFSVSAAIGFVALFGIAAMDGIIVLSYYNSLIDAGMERSEAIVRACEVQMRPVVMTCVAACVGLLPAALSTGIGSQVQKPLALVVVGGILLAPVLILVVLPVLIDLLSRRRRRCRGCGAGRAGQWGLNAWTRALHCVRSLSAAAAALAVALIAGCAAGPDFHRPGRAAGEQLYARAACARRQRLPTSAAAQRSDLFRAWTSRSSGGRCFGRRNSTR